MLLLRQVVIIAFGRLPHRIRFDRGGHQLERPVAHRILGVGLRGAADRHQGLHVFRMHDAPDVGLGATHRNAGSQRDIRYLQVIAQQAVVGLHHVVVAVLREFRSEAVGRLAGAPRSQGIDHHDIVTVRVDRTAGTDDGNAAGQRCTLDPLLVHIGGIAGIVGTDHHRIGDLAGCVAARGADGDVGRSQLAAPEQLQRRTSLAAEFPFFGIGEIVTTAQSEIRNLIVLLQPVMLRLR